MTDHFEHQVREMLRRRAGDVTDFAPTARSTTPIGRLVAGTGRLGNGRGAKARRAVNTGTVVDPRPERPWRRAMAAAVATAAAVVAIGFALVNAGTDAEITVADDGDRGDGAGPATDERSARQLPPGVFDTGLVVYEGDTVPIATAEAYLANRLPDLDTGVVIELTTIEADAGVVRWEWRKGDSADEFETEGWIHLRRAGDRWDVVAATTDGIDAADTEFAADGGRIRVTADRGQSLAVDLTDLATGRAIDARTGAFLPNRNGLTPLGTLASWEPSASDLEANVDEAVERPVIDRFGLRIVEVGGLLLSITEFPVAVSDVPTGGDHEGENSTAEPTAGPVDDERLAALVPTPEQLGPGWSVGAVTFVEERLTDNSDYCPTAGQLHVREGLAAEFAHVALPALGSITVTTGGPAHLESFDRAIEALVYCDVDEGAVEVVELDQARNEIPGARRVTTYHYTNAGTETTRAAIVVLGGDVAFHAEFVEHDGQPPIDLIGLATELFATYGDTS